MSAWFPSPYAPRVPGTGWIARERWQADIDKARNDKLTFNAADLNEQGTAEAAAAAPRVRSRLKTI